MSNLVRILFAIAAVVIAWFLLNFLLSALWLVWRLVLLAVIAVIVYLALQRLVK
ncbi:hypothetical protein [Serinibacter salmoneus]|uniref:Flagellar biosynthesis protein FlhA n=1 Tax=Serinibacter salmoneus TaxID=556530 RepID=A0A2A9D569_9MICO|nr:hypothetical protein [Serinibacter salmoneus]PFG21102.1 hypothetical protein ATL40_2722 [Serinibacter salmoneus]